MPLPRVYTISITGRSGSGKSTFASSLSRTLDTYGWTSTIVHLDNFYHDTLDVLAYDKPTAINWQSVQDLIALISVTRCPAPFDTTYPVDFLIVEGLFPLPEPVDMSIHLELDPDIAWLRRMQRGTCDPRIPRSHVNLCAAHYCTPSFAERATVVSSTRDADALARETALEILRHVRSLTAPPPAPTPRPRRTS